MKTSSSILAVLLISIFTKASTEADSWRECKGSRRGGGRIHSVSILGASDGDLPRGSSVDLIVSFDVTRTIDTATAEASGRFGGISFPYPLPYTDVCTGGVVNSLPCPLQPGKIYKLRYTIPIHQWYPEIAVLAKMVLKDASGDDVWCFAARVSIVDHQH